MAGVPHFKEWEFKGEYPFAEMEFRDASFPGGVKLSAFSTFIPLNDKDSSLPAAHFEVEFENPTSDRLDYTAFFTLNNPLPYGTGKNSFVKEGSMSGIQLECEKVDTKDLVWGNLCIATDHEDISYQENWYRARQNTIRAGRRRACHTGGSLRAGGRGEKENPLHSDLVFSELCQYMASRA